jgi:hypothetical protein
MFNDLPNEVFMFCGDLGAVSSSSDVMYDNYDNISFIGSGMGDVIGENFVVVNVLNNKSVEYDLICLGNVEDCLGELEDYQLTTGYPPIDSNFAEFNVFPNPAKDHINIRIDTNSKVTIYNISGQKVLEQFIFGKIKSRINVSVLSKGMYIGIINNESSYKNFKFIIQ